MDIALPRLGRSRPTLSRLLTRHDEPLPASYWLTAAVATVLILVCFATASWVPWFVGDTVAAVPSSVLALGGSVLLFLLGALFGLVLATVPWLALRWPGFAIVVALLPGAVTVLDPGDVGVHFGMFVALGAVALLAGWHQPVTAIVAVAVGLVIVWIWVGSGERMAAPFHSAIDLQLGRNATQVGIAYTVALLVVLAASAALRVSGVREAERQTLVARAGAVEERAAVVTERARLARDLHDVVAHHVSLIAVRAETAPYTHPGLAEDARVLLGEIAGDARLALDELRGVLGILGRAGEDGARTPQPSWGDIPALVTRAREAGTSVTVEGEAGVEVAPAAGYVAYRVVQEALTNARKHAAGHPVLVRLEATAALLTVLVVSGGASGAPTPTGGHGLVGMRERVEAVGGRLRVGVADGEFRVEATLPRAVTP